MAISEYEAARMPSRRCSGKISRQFVFTLGIVMFLTMPFLSCGSPTLPSEVSAETLSIRKLYPQTLKIAREWKEDAYLVDAETSFWTGDDEYRRGSFSFRSPSTNIVGLMVWYDPETDSFSDELLSIAKEDPRRRLEIEDADWRIDSIEALEIAQAHGGAEFLAERSGRDLRLYLNLEKRQRDGHLSTVWFVAYRESPVIQKFSVVVDALTGEVIETGSSQ